MATLSRLAWSHQSGLSSWNGFIEGDKVAGSGMHSGSGGVLVSDYGWVDAETVCKRTKESTQAFADRWHRLVEAIS